MVPGDQTQSLWELCRAGPHPMARGPVFCTRCHLPTESRAWGLPFLIRWRPLLFGCRCGGTVGRAEGEEKHRKKLEAGAGGPQATA